MAQAGGLKAVAKRTAFGDVSNTANASRPSKDDSAISVKGNVPLVQKPVIPSLQDKKSAALLRPAQRPFSVSSIKNLLHNVPVAISHAPVKQPLAEVPSVVQPTSQQAPPKKVNIKRSSVVFKDAVQSQADLPPSQAPKPSVTSAPVPPVRQELPPKPQPKQEAIIEKPQTKLHQNKTRAVDESKPQENNAEASSAPPSENNAAFRSDGIYIDNHGEVQQFRYDENSKPSEEEACSVTHGVALPAYAGKEMPTDDLDQLLDAQFAQSQQEATSKSKLVPVSEPDEYWDEEEENYEEDGYVTARSFKSRGDTTNGATTVLFPKFNQKIRKELVSAKELIERTRTVEDINEETWDTSMVAEYGDEIFQYMRDLEIKMLPNAHYMDNQAEIQWSMRSVLMDWLVQVHHRFGLLPETLFLCINYIDRFLSCKIVSLGKLQLVGATAIFVAAKYEEINCPSVQEIVYMVDGGYTVDEILKAERFMLSMLQFELGWPGPMSFLRRISKADDYDLETRTLAKYFLELTIMDERFVGSPPSFTAAGAHCLARMMLRKGVWSPAHTYYSNYTYTQLYSLVLLIVECCEDPRKHHCAIYDKYADKRFKRASLFAEAEMRKGFQVMDVMTNSMGGYQPYDEQQFWRHQVAPSAS
ncbi:MAG: hypothetical protein Q9167_007490 [Letrouitia subvulpina]